MIHWLQRDSEGQACAACLLQGIQHLRDVGMQNNCRARELFEQAVTLDPQYALAYAYLACIWVISRQTIAGI